MINTIKIARVTQDLTQAELAEKIGVTRQTIIAIESQNYTPSVLIALKISKVLKIPLEVLFVLESND